MKLPKKDNRRTNCIQNLRPILTLCSIFGVCTLSIKQSRLKLSWLKIGFCTVVIILCFAHLIVMPAVLKGKEETVGNVTLDDTKLDFTSPHFITKFVNPTAIAIIALYYRVYAVFVLHKRLPKTGEDLQKLDATLHLPQNHHKSDAKRLIFYAVFVATPIPLQIYANWDTASDFNQYKAFFFFDLFNNYALESTEFLFNALCYLIESRFRYICKKLQQQQQQKIAMNAICKTVDTFTLPKQNHEDLLVANEIQTLRMAFQKLVKLSEVVNNQYSVRLLMALGVCTFNVLTNLYMGLFGDSGNMVFDVKSMLKALSWACYYFARLVWICIACEFLCKEANAVRGSVSGVLNRNWGKLTKEELWIFLEVLQTTDVKFTACGFFTIDSTLITAAVATGATYLVVLAQFHSG